MCTPITLQEDLARAVITLEYSVPTPEDSGSVLRGWNITNSRCREYSLLS